MIGEYKLFIVNGEISYLERSYDFPDIRFATREEKRNTKIGAIDLETYALNSKSGLGVQEVYAGGWAVSGKGEQSFIIDNQELKTGTDIIQKMFKELFKLEKIDGTTLYAHNLGRFDSLFIIKKLIGLGYKI